MAVDQAETKPQPIRRRILVVDDSADNATSLAALLKVLGHDVRVAYSAAEAIEAAEQFRPGVILTDLNMPEMDGYEATRRIRSQPWGRSILICAVTGCDTQEHFYRSREAGIDHHLLKPLDLRLLNVILH